MISALGISFAKKSISEALKRSWGTEFKSNEQNFI